MLAQVRGDVVGAAVDQVVRRHRPGHRTRLDRLAEGPQVVLVQHPRADRARRGGPVRLVVVREPVLEDRARCASRSDGPRAGPGCRRWRWPRCSSGPPSSPPRCGPTGGGAAVDGRRPDVEADPVVLGAHRADLLGRPPRRPGAPAPSFQVAPRPTACGNTVAGPIHATPCSASWPVRNAADAEPLHGGRELVQEAIFSVGVEPRQQVVDALRERQARIAERRRGRRVCGHVGIPLRWSGAGAFEALRCSVDDGAGVKSTPPRCASDFKPCIKRVGTGASSVPTEVLGTTLVRPLGVHLTSQQHRSASTTRPGAASAHGPRTASAQPVPLETPQPTAHRRVSWCAMKG
ncbi:hypothetical protein SCYAM73S_06194 [Streptomyces cyaneofuscatus]